MVKSLEFFSKLQQVLYNWIFFVLVKSYPVSPVRSRCIVKKALFRPFLRSVLMNYLITLSLEKKLLFWKKVLNFGSKYLYEACLILNVAYRNIFQHLWAFRQLFSNRNVCVIVWTSIKLAYSQKLTEKSISDNSGCELRSYMINLSC